MLTQKISKNINSQGDKYLIYLGILQAISEFKITKQEKLILSRILQGGGLTKSVKEDLKTITSIDRVENVICKFRKNKILVGDKPNSKFPIFKDGDINFSITLKNV